MSKKINKIILLGPQGCGKSTQAKVIADYLQIPIVATGNILREEVNKQTADSQELANYINNGILVPDEVIIKFVFSRLDQAKGGFLLDGFPRILNQAKMFDDRYGVDKVFNIEISDEESVKRIVGRRLCDQNHVWHVEFKPPKQEGICDICGQPLRQRKDDEEATVRKRLATYHKETSPLLDHYKDKVVTFDGEQPIDKVTEDILNYLKINAG